ncbi:MAG: GNAT family N-acetyltransferase [Desulfovibrio sp.]
MSGEKREARDKDMLRLRPISVDDAPHLVRLLGEDREAVECMARVPWPLTLEGARQWLLTKGTSETVFAVLRPSDRAFLGTVGFWPAGGDGLESYELGYFIGREFWNQGFASAAVAKILDTARRLGVECLQALVRPENAASLRVLEKNGFIFMGEVERDQPLRGGMRTLELWERDIEPVGKSRETEAMRESLRRNKPRGWDE